MNHYTHTSQMAHAFTVENDTRGWIMTCLSGVACIMGSSVIWIDYIVRLFPGKKSFRIQDSDAFLSCSLSLAAGVMLFSSLSKLLESSKDSLIKGGFSPRAAAWILIACFMGGVFGIQILSRFFHHFMPSKVVGCDHTHDDQSSDDGHDQHDHDHHGHPHEHNTSAETDLDDEHKANSLQPSETTPLLSGAPNETRDAVQSPDDGASPLELGTWGGKPTLQYRLSMSFQQLVSTRKSFCDANGPCFGYSDRCGQECRKIVGSRRSKRLPHKTSRLNLVSSVDEEQAIRSPATIEPDDPCSSRTCPPPVAAQPTDFRATESRSHHHHVPENAFASISLQTSIAIALHKLPEGFITYATNHANPRLGLSVFLALFIHNISEGFALCLPLYLAMNSRSKALCVATILGGLTQPLGAGIAVLWLKVVERRRGDVGVSEGLYGGMFAVTAGIMASVALSLLQESFELTHNKRLCIAFAFVGMGILGVSAALTA